MATALVVNAGAPGDDDPSPDEIARRADWHRGLADPHAFLARITPAFPARIPADGSAPPRVETVVEVRSNGFAQQLVFVLAPHRGDIMLSTPEVVWLRPRRLHRLTRIPPELRMFDGASVADVTAVDVLGSYLPTFAAAESVDDDAYVLDLVATRAGVRYPHARYVIRREDLRPLRIDFMTRSGTVLKTTSYDRFEQVAGRTIATKLLIEDHVYGDASVVIMSDFRLLPPQDPDTFTPDHLLTIPDAT